MEWICHNGVFNKAAYPELPVDNRSFKWGDGLFETIKVYKSMIMLKELHFERLELGMQMLDMNIGNFEAFTLEQKILELCKRNLCDQLARVRLAVYRKDDNQPGYVIEARAQDQQINEWNEKGFYIDTYPLARKSMDGFSNLKSANFLPYVMAGLYSKENGLDDAIVLNSDNHISDSSRANVFLVKDRELYTPALNQGCVNGVMRRYLIDELHKAHFIVHQQPVQEKDLLEADEVFLTNAIFGMRWVKCFRNKNYSSQFSFTIYNKIMAGLYF